MLLPLLAACSGPAAPPRATVGIDRPSEAPPFARLNYAAFGRADAVAIALREWRLWGQAIDDDPPDTRPPPAPDDKPERVTGLWQRVGEYWWLGMNASSPEAGWTGKHDADGRVFPASRDGNYAWSAAFISYVMRIAGAGPRFPYSAAHATYINAARQAGLDGATDWALRAEPVTNAVPQPGDLICYGRNGAASMRYEDLPTATSFTSHCSIVVASTPGSLTVIGGNVDDSVTLTHVPTTTTGTLADPDGTLLDTRYPWFVVLKVLYQQ